MTTPEKSIEEYLVRKCAAAGLRCLKVKVVAYKGFPDRMIPLGSGKTFFVETKAAGGVLSPEQKREHVRLMKEGYQVAVPDSVRSVDLLMALIGLYV